MNLVRKFSLLLNFVRRTSRFQTEVLKSEVLTPPWHPNSLGFDVTSFPSSVRMHNVATFGPDARLKLELGQHLSPLSPLGICWQLAPSIDIAAELHFGLHFDHICHHKSSLAGVTSSLMMKYRQNQP